MVSEVSVPLACLQLVFSQIFSWTPRSKRVKVRQRKKKSKRRQKRKRARKGGEDRITHTKKSWTKLSLNTSGQKKKKNLPVITYWICIGKHL